MASSEPVTESDPLAQLVAECARGDRVAFASLYRTTSRKLLGLAMRITGRRETAEEALQEAYLAIWANVGRYEPGRAPVFAWMATIVRRRAIDRMRAEGARVRPVESVDVEGLAARDDRAANELLGGTARRVGECLDALEEQRRNAILMAFYGGLTHGELAERLEAPLGTVKSWIRRGLKELRECIET